MKENRICVDGRVQSRYLDTIELIDSIIALLSKSANQRRKAKKLLKDLHN